MFNIEICSFPTLFSKLSKCQVKFKYVHMGSIFRTFFSGENFGENSAENFPPKMLGKMEFSAEKVLKNRFSKKFRGKKCTKNRPQEVILYISIK
jgi:hypothetical protein